MNRFLRILIAAVLTLGLVGPFSTVTTFAQTTAGSQAASTSGAVQGTVHDSNGNPVADVSITMKGAATLTTRSDAKGTFAFANVTPGIYAVTATKAGYDTATDPAFSVLAGEVDKLDVVMNAITFSSLRTIASVRAVGRGTFNTTTASAQIVTNQQFEDQNATNVKAILDQTPGIVTDHPGTTANNSSPGAITFPSIRGGLGFETASLIDGHPLAVGLFGDYVTTFLNPFFLQSAEIIKGPGAMAPEVNYAIGGTVNFRTLDPARTPTGKIQLGVDSFGQQIGNYLYSGTTTNGKFGWVLGYGVDNDPGTLTNNTSAYYDLPRSVSINGGPALNFVTNPQPSTITGSNGIQNNPNNYASSLLASSFPVSQTFVSKSELAKLKFNFSKSTSFTASYLGSQTWTDQNGNHVYQYNQVFAPCYTGKQSTVVQNCPGYTGSLANGQTYPVWDQVFPPVGEWEVNNEPIFQGELRTTIGQDTLLARYYGASINRLQYNALNDVTQPLSMTFDLWGSDTNGKYYNGGPATVTWPTYSYYCLSSNKSGLNWSTNPYVVNKVSPSNGTCYYDASGNLMNKTTGSASNAAGAVGPAAGTAFFRSMEEDRIHGMSLQWNHPFNANGDLLTVSYDSNVFNTHAYSYLGDPSKAPSVPDGSRQRQGTLLVRGNFNLGTKWNVILSNYFNTYYQRFSTDGGSTFRDFTSSHYDPRIGLTFRSNPNVVWRFAAGSAIAPPYLGLLNSVNPAVIPAPGAGNTAVTVALANGLIKPETSFGYDLGADYRFGKDQSYSATWDAYETTLWNQFIKTTSLYCAGFNFTTQNCDSQTSTPTGDYQVFATQNRNLTHARYEGLELALRRTPLAGWGGHIQGALIRAYPYDLDPCFYSTTVNLKTGQPDCSQINTNLGILPNVNFQNTGSSGAPGSYNSVSNHAEPYAQGDLQLDYRWLSGTYAQFGYQLYGKNNSLNEPAFWVARGSLRVPTSKGSSITASVYNIFNTYGNSWITEFGGVPVPLANGKVGLTNANVIGPRTFTMVWRTDIGGNQ